MKTLKYLVFAGVIALVVGGLFVATSRAAQSAANDGTARGKLRERIRSQLNLTSEQIAQIKAQLKPEKSNITSLLTRLHDARTQLRSEIQKSDATEASVREASAKLSAVEADLAVERLKLHAKISPILTEEQRAKLAQIEAGIDQIVERAIGRMDTKLEK